MVNDKVLKEIDYLMRVADERDEERFRQLDETIRLYQKENKGRAEAAAAKAPFLPSIFRKRKFGRNGISFDESNNENSFREDPDSGSESTEIKKPLFEIEQRPFMYWFAFVINPR